MKRRDFLKTAAGLTAAITANRLLRNLPGNVVSANQIDSTANHSILPKRPYGKTGVELSIIGLGGLVLNGVQQTHADRTVAKAIEKGVNYFDVAPTYGDAELRLGPALKPFRKNVFLACKTTQRTRDAARAELERSLQRLQTDHLDLYQLHALTDLAKDVDVAFAAGGAMETLIEAKKSGLVRYLGFSAHSVEAALAAMDRYDFDSVLFPINFVCYYSGNLGRQVIEKAKSKGLAILAIKAIAHQPWPTLDHPKRREFAKCWYLPLSDPAQAQLALRFTLSQPVTAAVPPADEKLFWLAVDLAMNFKPLKKSETKKIESWAAGTRPIFSYQKEDES